MAALVAIAGLCVGPFGFFFVLMLGQYFVGRNLMLPLALFWCCTLPVAAAALFAAPADRTRVAGWVSMIALVFWTVALRYTTTLQSLEVGWWPQMIAVVGVGAVVLWFSPVRRGLPLWNFRAFPGAPGRLIF